MRLIFEYDGEDVRLLSKHPVDIVHRGQDESGHGHFLDAHSHAGHRVARIPLGGAFETSREVFPEHPHEPFSRVAVEPKGAFSVVVPSISEVDHVRIVHVGPPPRHAFFARAAHEPAEREIARIPIDPA